MNITQIYTHPSRYKPRGAQAPVAIILHEVNEPLGALGARIGTNLINALKPTAHQSYHYALDGAAVHAFVDPAQAARALDDAEVLVDWTPQAGFPGVDPDLYTINIAVIVGSFRLATTCASPAAAASIRQSSCGTCGACSTASQPNTTSAWPMTCSGCTTTSCATSA
jgi:hypothetical protein